MLPQCLSKLARILPPHSLLASVQATSPHHLSSTGRFANVFVSFAPSSTSRCTPSATGAVVSEKAPFSSGSTTARACSACHRPPRRVDTARRGGRAPFAVRHAPAVWMSCVGGPAHIVARRRGDKVGARAGSQRRPCSGGMSYRSCVAHTASARCRPYSRRRPVGRRGESPSRASGILCARCRAIRGCQLRVLQGVNTWCQ